ncbi:ferredoxin [Trichocoleus sp. FACHB-262]|uniref:(2Fe-2S) ferredoxin domain-containing protein n=1 Tax=Trichocoleus sp. FACHB-262 TaxID=2692869 RepID=UPI0016884621|nr:(2Fe-2S) ferredoxin domain-containing protein [Trichocoleus sp. FACHB-262]MBD2122727.1 (2Fe-2S) ferredoxin domain-containing protein [Trichocoleus sp. FACHB-262]
MEDPAGQRQVLVCQYQNCLARGSAQVLAAFQSQPVPDASISASGCLGQCNMGPNVRVVPDEVWYCRVQPSDVPAVVEEHLQAGHAVESLLHPRFHPKRF